MSEDEKDNKRIYCNLCRTFTNHHLQARYARVRKGVEDGDGNFVAFIDETDGGELEVTDKMIDTGRRFVSSIWSCAGCDSETFEWQYQSEGDNGEWFAQEAAYYPERVQGPASKAPKHFSKLPEKLNTCYRELIACFNQGHLLLCTIGLRALLEGICKEKGLKEGNLERKVDGLVKFLPSINLIQSLHEFRIIGNAAAHDLEKSLGRDDAETVIGIVEDILNLFYDLDYRATQLKIVKDRGGPRSGLVH